MNNNGIQRCRHCGKMYRVIEPLQVLSPDKSYYAYLYRYTEFCTEACDKDSMENLRCAFCLNATQGIGAQPETNPDYNGYHIDSGPLQGCIAVCHTCVKDILDPCNIVY